jgi:uncharacterized membrane protein
MTYGTHTYQLVVYGYQGMVGLYGFILPLLIVVYGILAPNATLFRFEQWRNRNYFERTPRADVAHSARSRRLHNQDGGGGDDAETKIVLTPNDNSWICQCGIRPLYKC